VRLHIRYAPHTPNHCLTYWIFRLHSDFNYYKINNPVMSNMFRTFSLCLLTVKHPMFTRFTRNCIIRKINSIYKRFKHLYCQVNIIEEICLKCIVAGSQLYILKIFFFAVYSLLQSNNALFLKTVVASFLFVKASLQFPINPKKHNCNSSCVRTTGLSLRYCKHLRQGNSAKYLKI